MIIARMPKKGSQAFVDFEYSIPLQLDIFVVNDTLEIDYSKWGIEDVIVDNPPNKFLILVKSQRNTTKVKLPANLSQLEDMPSQPNKVATHVCIFIIFLFWFEHFCYCLLYFLGMTL